MPRSFTIPSRHAFPNPPHLINQSTHPLHSPMKHGATSPPPTVPQRHEGGLVGALQRRRGHRGQAWRYAAAQHAAGHLRPQLGSSGGAWHLAGQVLLHHRLVASLLLVAMPFVPNVANIAPFVVRPGAPSSVLVIEFFLGGFRKLPLPAGSSCSARSKPDCMFAQNQGVATPWNKKKKKMKKEKALTHCFRGSAACFEVQTNICFRDSAQERK